VGTGKLITGVWAALRTPRTERGALDEGAFLRQLDFLAQRGLTRVVLNGATGEYPLVPLDELRQLLSLTASRNLDFLCGIGSAGIHRTVKAGQAAVQAGAKALLLPMPYLFPYSQSDLAEFTRSVARTLPQPILLYNLPHFTTGLEPDTVAQLVADCPNVIGIKDSGGTLDILRALPADCCRIVGDDAVLVSALHAGICDGVISGVANVLPGLLMRIFTRQGSKMQDNEQLDEFLTHLNGFPIPWGLKLAAECLGLGEATFEQPLSPERMRQADAFREWFRGKDSAMGMG
jgi:4-hydroxy-tetrahydrodipicolinate synthase